jgi:hypothetical protein
MWLPDWGLKREDTFHRFLRIPCSHHPDGENKAATVVTGGRCTEKQKSTKLTSCETSEFTNNAGQTGYKCTCTDKIVRANPALDQGATAIDPSVTPSDPASAPPPAAQKTQPRN